MPTKTAYKDTAPQLNVAKIRGQLAERQISRLDFAIEAGIGYDACCQTLAGNYPYASELIRFKIAAAAQRLGFTDYLLSDQPESDEVDQSA